MGREKLVKLSDEEHAAVEKVKELCKQYGISTFSEACQKKLTNGDLGGFIHLGAQLVIEHFKNFGEK